MSREEFIGKLQLCYFGDRNAFNDIVCAYDSLLVRNEKAIEYIKQHKETREHYEPYGTPMGNSNYITTHIFGYYELLNILQNGSEIK